MTAISPCAELLIMIVSILVKNNSLYKFLLFFNFNVYILSISIYILFFWCKYFLAGKPTALLVSICTGW